MATKEINQAKFAEKVKEIYPEAFTKWNHAGYFAVMPYQPEMPGQPELGKGDNELLAWASAAKNLAH